MYTAIIIILIVIFGWLLSTGIKNNNKFRISVAISLGIFGYLFFWLMGFWGEMLWFQNIGFPERFWTFELNRYAFVLGGFVFGFMLVYLVGFSLKGLRKNLRITASVIGGLASATWGSSNWDTYLKFLNRVDAGITDPIFNMDAGFYLFTLPFLDGIYILLAILFLICLVASIIGIFSFIRSGGSIKIENRLNQNEKLNGKSGYPSLIISAGAFLLVMAFMKYLDRYHLLYSNYGIVSGPGWTDIHVRLPALTVVIIITLLAAIMIFLTPLREWADWLSGKVRKKISSARVSSLITIYLSTFVLWFIGLTIIPGLFQWLKVEPNELKLEEKYINYNINYTRKAFALDRVEEKKFPATNSFTHESYQNNQNIFNNIRLWDYRALDAVYKQFQEIRLYYEFSDVDVDRYHINGKYRQVMISAREMELKNLPQQSQTFVNRRFKYTHGYGITLANVSEFTENGLPNLLVKDIPPKSTYESLVVDQPSLYFGELTREHVIANSKEEEFDYPKGERNEYVRYAGEGGVAISNFWRKLLFGWKFDGTRLLFSGYPKKDSRILFHRQIRDRVHTIAPFLNLDDDPYITLINGQLFWIIDAYTTSSYFPYSEHFDAREDIEYIKGDRNRLLETNAGWQLHGKNYVRNSVKAFINAYSGEVELYIFDDSDPIIKVWSNILPKVFKSKDQIPESYRQHIRYPADFLLVQGLMYAKYHMTDPTVFYNQEDLWIRATEKYYGSVQAVEPYYVMWEPQGSNEQEFILMLPFTPKNRQVAIGWIAGMCDMENYGRFLAYKFPKEKRILGPQQVETKIDQDRYLSGQLTLWDQRGSNVIRGNVLAIPVDNTIIYVEPIYLQAETAAYPELRLVAIMHNDKLSYAENFEKAIRGLFTETDGPVEQEPGADMPKTMEELIKKANDAFNSYIRSTGNKNFQEASRSLEELEKILNEMDEQQDSSNEKINNPG
jgi:uncharacterized membrane protein (UPF0182 family)